MAKADIRNKIKPLEATRSAVAFVIVALGITQAAYAGPSYVGWSSNAAGCSVGDPAIQNNRYLITAGTVKHQDTNVDLITLYCPVNTITPAMTTVNHQAVVGHNLPTRLWVTYRASTGSANNLNFVTASLIRMNRANGGITTIATFRSHDFADTGDALNSVGFDEGWNFGENTYYVRVDLKRNTASDIVILYAVAVGGEPVK